MVREAWYAGAVYSVREGKLPLVAKLRKAILLSDAKADGLGLIACLKSVRNPFTRFDLQVYY